MRCNISMDPYVEISYHTCVQKWLQRVHTRISCTVITVMGSQYCTHLVQVIVTYINKPLRTWIHPLLPEHTIREYTTPPKHIYVHGNHSNLMYVPVEFIQ